MIVVNELEKHFQDTKRGVVRAVDGVSFECRPGEIFGLLGANGAGKTTLMRLLSTVIRPTAGSASIAGHDIEREAEAVRRNIGFMSTTTALYTRLTAREMITYAGNLQGMAAKQLAARTEEVIQMLGISEFSNRLCDKLSTGQKQRVSLARTVLHDPPVLFFDEPTAGLDVLAGLTVMEFIEGRKTAGKTVVFCTHVMSEAERLCDRIAVIHEGKLAAIGTLSQLQSQTGHQRLEDVFLSLVQKEKVA